MLHLRQIKWLYVIAFVFDFAAGGLVVVLPQYAMDAFHAGSWQLGILGMSQGLSYAAGCLLLGRSVDRWPRVRMMKIASFMALGGMLCMMRVRQFWWIVLCMSVFSFAVSGIWPAVQSLLAEGKDKNALMKTLTGFALCWGTGFMLGLGSAGKAYELARNASWDASWIWIRFCPPAMCLSVGSYVVGLIVLFSVRWDDRRLPRLDLEQDAAEGISLQRKKYGHAAWIVNFVTLFVAATMVTVFPKLGRELGIQAALFGLIFAVSRLMQLAVYPLMYAYQGWHYRVIPLVSVQLLTGLGLVLIILARDQRLVWSGAVCIGISNGFAYMSATFYAVFGAARRGRNLGIHEAVIGSAIFLGPFVSGAVAKYFVRHAIWPGIRAPYYFLLGLVACGILLECMYILPGRRKGMAGAG